MLPADNQILTHDNPKRQKSFQIKDFQKLIWPY